MKNIQIILIIAILILIYLISMQWIGDKSPSDDTVTPRPPIVETQLPAVVTPETPAPVDTATQQTESTVVSPETQVTPTPPVVVETPTVTPTPTADSTTALDMSKLIEYTNANFGYHFSMPKKVYYAGFGARDGALHTVAIQADASPETFEAGTTRVLYYGKKILPELKGTTRYVDPNGKYILLLLNNAYSVRIESDNLKSTTVQAIEATIGMN